MKLAVVGCVGIPARYGGFETLVENLARYHEEHGVDCEMTVFCSGKAYSERPTHYRGASLKYLPLHANGPQSLPYDVLSMLAALRSGADVILVLGVSGAIAIPLLRLLTPVRIITNVDGIEWKRQKWKGLSRWFLRISEGIAAKWSHAVVADNAEIGKHIKIHYGIESSVIPYGGDHVLATPACNAAELDLPSRYALSICRIEPENNVKMIVEGFAKQNQLELVFVGNWNSSSYGRSIRENFVDTSHLHLLDPIYDPGKLRALHDGASLYVHGHSAGGTNPSLVEAMHCHETIFAFDCAFNRATTEEVSEYFSDVEQLEQLIYKQVHGRLPQRQTTLNEIASRRYRWSIVAKQYFDIVGCARQAARGRRGDVAIAQNL